MSEQLEMFEQPVDTSVTTEDLDTAVELMAEAKADYEAKKSISNEAHAEWQTHKAKVISLLRSINKKKYTVDGVGTVSVTEKLKVRTPQAHEDKELFFAWVNENFGREGFLSYLGINYNTLNALYNDQFTKAKEDGVASDFNIPGVRNPEAEYGLSVRK